MLSPSVAQLSSAFLYSSCFPAATDMLPSSRPSPSMSSQSSYLVRCLATLLIFDQSKAQKSSYTDAYTHRESTYCQTLLYEQRLQKQYCSYLGSGCIIFQTNICVETGRFKYHESYILSGKNDGIWQFTSKMVQKKRFCRKSELMVQNRLKQIFI